jgi:predicted lipid-binding transport protein (Tim44 family)
MSNGTSSELARAIQDVTEKAQLLVREEIALARAEVTDKVGKLARGAAVGAAAGVFLIGFLIMLMHALAWAIWSILSDSSGSIWLGFAILALLLLILAAVAGLVAYRFVRRGTPPTPQMAIEEAQLIRQTVASAREKREPAVPATTTRAVDQPVVSGTGGGASPSSGARAAGDRS